MTYSVEAEARWSQDQITAYLNGVDRTEAAYDAADTEFGPDWEDNSREPEYRNYISYWDVDENAGLRAEFAAMADADAFGGFHNP